MQRRAFLAGGIALAATPAISGTLTVDGGTITIDLRGDPPPGFAMLAENWVRKSAAAVALYYGRFPVPELAVRLIVGQDGGVHGGQTFPGDVPAIRIRVGGRSDPADLLVKDWVMVHEMVHLAFPWLDLQHNWMAEGLAVYVESIARVQAGHIRPQQAWGDFVKMMPRGLPHDGDGGFEATLSHGRTYLGGAMFCLLADIRIRQYTDNRLGLQQALRGINAVRDFRRQWDFEETLAIGDRATGTHALRDQYMEMKDQPVTPDLDALWHGLGVMARDGGIAFDRNARLAAVREAIETPVS